MFSWSGSGTGPANIAEGHARLHRKEFEHHLSIARGSLAEFETHLEIAASLGYVNAEQARSLGDGAGQVGRTLKGLLASVRKIRDSAKGAGRDAVTLTPSP